MNSSAIIREAHYSHTVGLVSPAYEAFGNWTVTAAALHISLAKHGLTPDDITWDTPGNKKLTEYSISCLLAKIKGFVRFRLTAIEVFLSSETQPIGDVPSVVADAVQAYRAISPNLLTCAHTVVLGAHMELVDGSLESLMRGLVNHQGTPPVSAVQAITFGLDLPREQKGMVEVQRSLRFAGPSFLFGRVSCDWVGDLDERAAYEQSLQASRAAAGSIGLAPVWGDRLPYD